MHPVDMLSCVVGHTTNMLTVNVWCTTWSLCEPASAQTDMDHAVHCTPTVNICTHTPNYNVLNKSSNDNANISVVQNHNTLLAVHHSMC
jgi:hypothetical protein